MRCCVTLMYFCKHWWQFSESLWNIEQNPWLKLNSVCSVAENFTTAVKYNFVLSHHTNHFISLFGDVFWFQKQDQYILKVKGQDLNGKPGGKTGVGTVTINIQDVNDNLPILEKEVVVFFFILMQRRTVSMRGFRVSVKTLCDCAVTFIW